jgi:nucleotide-binding universal stress UspA family protein
MPLGRRAAAGSAPRVRRILVGTDLSETAGRAVAWAADMAARYEAELLLVRVVATDTAGAREELDRYAAGVAPGATTLVAVGEDPADAIVEAIERERADVVVVGSVGMRGRRQFLLGNVPNRVSHAAGCTVVIVNTA